MTRTLSERLDHTAVLADRLSNGDLQSFGQPHGGPLHRLGDAFIACARAELDVARAVFAAREAGHAWAQIGAVLGTSDRAASRRYGKPDILTSSSK